MSDARLLVAMALVLLALTAVGTAAGQTSPTPTPEPIEENTTYYDNETGNVSLEGWVAGDGNATAAGALEMLARIPGMFIGGGDVDPSGSGTEGLLLTGLVIGAATLFATVGTGIGPIGGSVLGMVLAYGLTAVGIIPVWIQPLLLFTIVGVPASAAVLRVFRR